MRIKEIVFARWNDVSWSQLERECNGFKRRTYGFTMITRTPNFDHYTESISSTTLARAICKVFEK